MYLSTRADACRTSTVETIDSNPGTKKLETKKNDHEGTGTLEYAKLWEELRYTGQGLEDLFEQSKRSAYDVKSAYESIHQLITINEGLKVKYYEALSNKKRFEEERDEYFQTDAELQKRKDDFIEDSQKHALQHSRYVEYSKRFSRRREDYVKRLLKDVERYLNQVETLSKEKQKLRKEVSDQRQEIYSLKNDMKILNVQRETAIQSCEKYKKELDAKKKENQWLSNQTEKLKALKLHLDEEIDNLKRKEKELQEDLERSTITIDDLAEQRKELRDRCSQLNQLLQGKEEELNREEEERNSERARYEDEKRYLEKTLNDIEGQKQKLRDSNQRLLKQLGQTRKRLDETKKKSAVVEKEKNKSVMREHRTSDKNVELSTQHLELIDEVLALKKTFFDDQERLKLGGRQYKRLESKMNALKKQMDILEENGKLTDPDKSLKEYKEEVIKKVVNSPVEDPPRYGRTYNDTVLKHRTPAIGHMPKPNRKPDVTR